MPRSTWDLRRYFWAPRLGHARHLPADRVPRRRPSSRAAASAAARSATRTRSTARPTASTPIRSGRGWRTGRRRSRRTTTPRSGCSASSPWRPTTPPTSSCASSAREIGADRTYAKTRVGVYFGTPGETVADPFFGGAGPARTGCIACGRCMVGCPHNAKNTLPKNYLWLAERAGATITPDRTVVDIRPLGAADGADGYAVTTEATGALAPPRPPRAHRARRRRRRRRARHEPAARRARGCAARCRASPPGSASWCARTRRRSSPSRCRAARRT